MSGPRFPVGESFAPQAQLLEEIGASRAGALGLHLRNYGALQLKTLEGRQIDLPAGGSAIDARRLVGKVDCRFPRNTVETAVMKDEGVAVDHRLVIVTQAVTGNAADLEDIHEVGFVGQLDHQHDIMKIEILERDVVVEGVGGEQLLAPDVYRVLGNLEIVAQSGLSRRQLDLRRKGLLRAGGQDHGSVTADPQLQTAQEAGIVEEQPDIGRARGHDVARQYGCTQSPANKITLICGKPFSSNTR